MNLNIKEQKFITEEEIENSNGMVYDPSGDEMATEESLPNANEILDQVILILESMNIEGMCELRKNNKLAYEESMEAKFPTFSERYYGIFRMIIDGEDITPLYTMLSIINKVKNGHSTLENAEKDVGKYLTKFLPDDIINKMEDGSLTEKDVKVINN